MNQMLPRMVTPLLAEMLKAMPAVVVTGARQTGKSTLSRDLTPGRRDYHSLDDLDVVDLARRDPETLTGGTRPVAIDEIQREPQLLRYVKLAIDRERRAGQFLLTGSANLLMMKQVSETLAGRASYLTLWPMTRREQLGLGRCGLWNELWNASDHEWLDLVEAVPGDTEDWRPMARRGGYPTPAIHMDSDRERSIWFDAYVTTYLERDLQDLSTIAALPDFRRLMRAVCLRLGQMLNQTELGRDVALPQPTVHRYLNLLETSYLLVRLPAYSVNRTKRLIKTPKAYWSDTGLALHLAGSGQPQGAHLENVVLGDLVAWRDGDVDRTEILYWRTTTGEEVDFVIERDARILPIEVKATTRPSLRDTANLQAFRTEYGSTARAGLLLHTGPTLKWLAPGILAAPWWRVL